MKTATLPLLSVCIASVACSAAPGGGSSTGGTGGGAGADPYSGPFKILVLSETLGYHHDSIPAGQQMLRDLGQCVDAASCALTNDVPIAAAKPNSSFTVDVAGAPAGCPAATPSNYGAYAAMGCDGNTTDLSQFTTENLKNYQMIFFVSPTGAVFSTGGNNGLAGMAAIQAFIEGGGAYGGVHSATDFEDAGGWPWYTDELVGAHFVAHNVDGTPGIVTTAPAYTTHPVMRDLPSPLSTLDEWYFLSRPIAAQPGFQVLATLSGVPLLPGEPAGDVRPMVWIKQFPVTGDPTREGRMFYTCRGHNIVRYGEAPFRQLVHQGILWATHRLD
jgi:type 1 glutamine amidotransferase